MGRKFYLNSMNEKLPPNSEVPYRVAYLIAGYISNSLTEKEKDELDEWVTASDENMRLFADLTDEQTIEKGLKERGLYNADAAVEKLKQRIRSRERKKVKPLAFLAVGIAASVLLVAGVYFFTPLFHKTPTATAAPVAKADLLPGTERALLSLPDGRQILLDSSRGTILQQDNLQVTNTGGAVSYQGVTKEAEWHSLTIPRGGHYQLTLADGSTVWLNAESSIRFPTAFLSNERRVEIRGEAYFEVAHDAERPFHVSVLRQAGDEQPVDVEVLGTHFNINAYPDEESIKTTLIQGSVKVSAAGKAVTIQPGEQARVNAVGLVVTREVNPEEVMAWKNGLFEFKDAPIEEIMRQVARWYDVTVKYEGRPGYHFNASIPRNVPVSKLFHLLELTDQVHFTIEDKTIIVKP
jgi:ferric-dicitrate binding protein FerR (iron transport regulator)